MNMSADASPSGSSSIDANASDAAEADDRHEEQAEHAAARAETARTHAP